MQGPSRVTQVEGHNAFNVGNRDRSEVSAVLPSVGIITSHLAAIVCVLNGVQTFRQPQWGDRVFDHHDVANFECLRLAEQNEFSPNQRRFHARPINAKAPPTPQEPGSHFTDDA